ncbi:MAG: MOSC domain-containing protein [Acidobacteria bacterium]|nr:MOSC domain-containing protein [Acidobacteriota bacterium]
MTPVGAVESLWRYPVKSMGGERVARAFVGFSGVYGDRCYAFRNSEARKGFPYLNATAEPRILGFRPRFRHPERAALPPNLAEASSIPPGVTYANGDPEDLALDVLTPAGEVVDVEDPALVKLLGEGLDEKNRLALVRSDRALTDCRPVSLISLQTVRQLEGELGRPLDKRRFRANVYLDLASGGGFEEDALVGRRLRIGPSALVAVLERDPRCKMVSLDPETCEHDPDVLRLVARAHETYAGVYCAVMVEGIVSEGDPVEVLD